jgi:uncharacterized protein (TIGR04255 family)
MINVMEVYPHHPQAPITEAVLDIRVDLPEETTLEALAQLGSKWREEYPTRRDRLQLRGEWTMGTEVSVRGKQSQLGYIYVSQDDLQVVQARLDGFTFSRLRPYINWEHFCSEARRLWRIYREGTAVKSITRIAVRYINRLDLPMVGEKIDLKDYLRTGPEISPELPQNLNGYFMQLRIPLDDVASEVIVTQTIVEPAQEDVASILLDIDLFRTADIPQDEEQLWHTFDQLRPVKNQVFEASITDRTRELIN